ncbi:hypothetical protein CISIN_1g014078mg [Citrus sinensis]|uniref:Uncharacterized protein n=1 Tax=Citrus sinensis TaxID=2711 RepID=A0A067H785_CITSI|nr:hypothetical protein CISIN_1g014078mg [Citrus sinensis]
MALPVIRSNRSLVRPAEHTPTPSGTLDLSSIDQIPVLRCNARTLHVFKRRGPEPEAAAHVIKGALSRALVPYYPLAGRLKESSQGQFQVECSGDGAWFVEASAICTLDSVDYFNDVTSIPYDQLLPDSVPKTDGDVEPLVQMQVTQFACGGFVIGLTFCHSICDGLGAAQFLNAVGELARGLEHPRVAPVWHRDFFPSTPQTRLENATLLHNYLPPPMPSYRLEHANIDIPMDQINQLKRQFYDSTGLKCSAFEIVAASLWRHRTRAISFGPNTQLKLVFFANCRQLLDPPLPKGFYGNCFFPVTITTTSDWLTQATNVDVVKLIQEAKAELPVEFAKYMNGDFTRNGEDPFAPPLAYTTLFISEWGRLGFNQIDYGWGPPVHVVPIQGSSIIPVGIVGSMPLPKVGFRLMTWSVREAHLKTFLDLITNSI